MAKRNDNSTNILFRYGIVVLMILVLASVIIVKLTETTVVYADKWNHGRNSRELQSSKIILPQRGDILASDGSILATDLTFWNARMDYRAEKFNEKMLKDSIKVLSAAMAAHFPRKSAAEWEEMLLKPLDKDPDKRPRAYKLLSGLSHSEMELLKTLPYFAKRSRNRSGLTFESYSRRFNPYGNMAKRSIGRVGETAESSEVHGRSGIEMALDSLLYGRTGVTRKVQVTKDIKDMADIPAQRGCDVVTTIDINMQDLVENELNNVLDSCSAEWGVALLMDVHTGDIKAISNLEKDSAGNGYIEARNRAVLRYEPGSVIKTLSMTIAVEDGLVTDFDEMLPTGAGWAYAGGRPITDSHRNEAVRVGDVIEQSSNIGMARIITRKYDSNPGAFYSRVKRTGFLDPLNTGIGGEVPPRFDSVPSDRGGRIALSRQSYGYATEIPPIYTMALYNAIANEGKFVRPRLVKELRGGSRDTVFEPTYIGSGRLCSPKTAAVMREMLGRVVTGERGTGRFLRNDLVKIAGKTGTCYQIENGQYNTSAKRLAFCGFFPADKPKYTCMVLMCYPKRNFFGAATTSGQVVKNVAMKLYARGLLDNSTDLEGDSLIKSGPTFYAKADNGSRSTYQKVKPAFGLMTAKSIKSPAKTGRGVPDVCGLGLGDALAVLEAEGYNVTVSGTGFVRHQNPGAGTPARKGTKIALTLDR